MFSLLLVFLGILIGAFGTLIGAGGGFILVPVLLLLYPARSPEVITAISLAVVCLNAVSGSVAYAFKKRIDYKSAVLFTITNVPGAVIGALLTTYISRNTFNIVFGSLLILISSVLIIKPSKPSVSGQEVASAYILPMIRRITDNYGTRYAYRYDLITASILSFFVGIMSSLLGIGGGIIHVPAMVSLLNFPVHIATATSHFVLAFTGLAGSLTHWKDGDLQGSLNEILFLGIGVIAGAQLGAAFSHRVNERQIIRSLAIALLIVAFRILWMTMGT